MIDKLKTVYIRRVDIDLLPGYDQEDYIAKIGAAFSKEGSDTLRGLTAEEERKYLPAIIGIEPTAPLWESKTRNYWASISVPIEADGKKLQVGLRYPSEEAAEKGKDGIPINIPDYILYRYCLVYGRVANSKAEVTNSSKKIKFYLEDLEAEKKIQISNHKLSLDAFQAYMKMLEDMKVVRYVLWIEKDRIAEDLNPSAITDDEASIALNTFCTRFPSEMIKYDKEKDTIRYKAFVTRAVHFGVLTRIPNTTTYMYMQDGENVTLGNSLNEAAAYIKLPEAENLKKRIEAKIASNPKTLN